MIRYSILKVKDISDKIHNDLLSLSLYSIYRTTNKEQMENKTVHRFCSLKNKYSRTSKQQLPYKQIA